MAYRGSKAAPTAAVEIDRPIDQPRSARRPIFSLAAPLLAVSRPPPARGVCPLVTDLPSEI